MNIENLKKVNVDLPDDYEKGIVLIDVFTVWCGPCKFVAPILHKLRDEGLFKLIQIDLDQNRKLGDMFGITAIPTLLFFCDGEIKKRTEGKYNTERLEQELGDLLERCPT